MPDSSLLKALAGLEPSAFRRLQARLAILRAYVRHRERHHLSDAQAQDDISEQFSEQTLEIPRWVYDEYDSVSGRTLRRWEKQAEADGLEGLVDSHGRRSSRTYSSYFDPGTEMHRTALHFLADHPGCTAPDLLEELRRHFSEEALPDLRTVQRFLARINA